MGIFYRPEKATTLKVKGAGKPRAKADAGEIGEIQGNKPGSRLEWNVSLALDQMQLEYIYQYVIGGIRVLGTYVLDFLVLTPGLSTPLLVHGRYWHTGLKADDMEEGRIVQLMGGRCRKPVIIWEENCLTPEAALSWLRQNLWQG